MDSDFENIVNMMLSFFREIESIDENVTEPERNRRYRKIGGVTYLVNSNVGSAHKPLVAEKISRLVKKSSK